MSLLEKVAVWQRADGGVSITHFDDRDKLSGESDEDFIERISLKHGTAPFLQGATRTIISKTKLPKTKTNRNKWRLKAGKVSVDKSVQLPEDIKESLRSSAKEKLKTGKPLTDEESDAVIN